MPHNTRKPAETPATERASESPVETPPLESEQASQAPVEAPVLDTEQATETPAVVETHIPLWQDLLDHAPRRPRKGLPAVALGFGLGLIVMGGLWLLYPANVLVWAIMVPGGGVCIVWAVFPQD